MQSPPGGAFSEMTTVVRQSPPRNRCNNLPRSCVHFGLEFMVVLLSAVRVHHLRHVLQVTSSTIKMPFCWSFRFRYIPLAPVCKRSSITRTDKNTKMNHPIRRCPTIKIGSRTQVTCSDLLLERRDTEVPSRGKRKTVISRTKPELLTLLRCLGRHASVPYTNEIIYMPFSFGSRNDDTLSSALNAKGLLLPSFQPLFHLSLHTCGNTKKHIPAPRNNSSRTTT